MKITSPNIIITGIGVIYFLMIPIVLSVLLLVGQKIYWESLPVMFSISLFGLVGVWLIERLHISALKSRAEAEEALEQIRKNLQDAIRS